jgi:hypothetical protein
MHAAALLHEHSITKHLTISMSRPCRTRAALMAAGSSHTAALLLLRRAEGTSASASSWL